MIEGIIYTLCSAASFGMNGVATRRGLVRVAASLGLYVTVLAGVPLFLVAALATGQLWGAGRIRPEGYWLLAAAGIIHFLLGRYCNYRAVGAIGANRTTPIQALNSVYSVVVAVIFLQEQVSWQTAVGIACVMVGPALIGLGSARSRAQARAVSPSLGAAAARTEHALPPVKLAEGYIFGILSAVAYGTSPVLISAGLQGSGGLGILGGLVSYVAASAVLVALLPFKHDRAALLSLDRRSAGWFGLASLTVFSAQFFRYLALGVAPVTLVVPLSQTRPLFTVLFSFLFNRHLESFAPPVLIGIAMSIAGAFILGSG